MKEAVTIPVTAVGLLAEPGICEYILQNNQADLILQGRALIRNVNWLADAAKELKDKEFQVFNQSYFRGQHKYLISKESRMIIIYEIYKNAAEIVSDFCRIFVFIFKGLGKKSVIK